MTTANDIIDALCAMADAQQRQVLMRFFKTGRGEYGQGDAFLGIRVPTTRQISKAAARDLPLTEVPTLLTHRYHEVRLCGLLILTYRMKPLCRARLHHDAAAIAERDAIVSLYLRYADWANNWDLVDVSAPWIIGQWLMLPSAIADKEGVMDALADSPVLWRQRIAMVSTSQPTRQGRPEYALRYAERLLFHPHDLMHKAVGWMLREVGSRCDLSLLRDFLTRYAATMPRTTLRYAIEHLAEPERQHWMAQRKAGA